jgi:broad specificity phosphatase PhoE
MSRALETAQLIAGPSWPNIIVEPALKEISLGLWEGLGKKVVQSLYPDFWEARGKNPDEVAPPEGESFADLAKRVIPAFERIAAFGREGTSVLVVAHQGVNRVILARERGLNLSQILTINQPTCCLTLLRADR